MAGLDFYDAGALRQIATNLFYGWGYNFYKQENQLRADDQIVRAKAGWILSNAAASVDAAESDFRREFLPAPTRAKPFPMQVRWLPYSNWSGWQRTFALWRIGWRSCRCQRTIA